MNFVSSLWAKNCRSSNFFWQFHFISSSVSFEIKHYKSKSKTVNLPANIYLFKFNNRNTRNRCKIFLKLTLKHQNDAIDITRYIKENIIKCYLGYIQWVGSGLFLTSYLVTLSWFWSTLWTRNLNLTYIRRSYDVQHSKGTSYVNWYRVSTGYYIHFKVSTWKDTYGFFFEGIPLILNIFNKS